MPTEACGHRRGVQAVGRSRHELGAGVGEQLLKGALLPAVHALDLVAIPAARPGCQMAACMVTQELLQDTLTVDPIPAHQPGCQKAAFTMRQTVGTGSALPSTEAAADRGAVLHARQPSSRLTGIAADAMEACVGLAAVQCIIAAECVPR